MNYDWLYYEYYYLGFRWFSKFKPVKATVNLLVHNNYSQSSQLIQILPGYSFYSTTSYYISILILKCKYGFKFEITHSNHTQVKSNTPNLKDSIYLTSVHTTSCAWEEYKNRITAKQCPQHEKWRRFRILDITAPKGVICAPSLFLKQVSSILVGISILHYRFLNKFLVYWYLLA